MELSIIIPCYNAERYLMACMESVLAQTVAEYEVILVDDGSTDTTAALCDQLAAQHGNVRVLHTANGGPGTAKNCGFDVAQGEYVAYIDSDDSLEPVMYERMLELAHREQADIVCCSYRQVDEAGNRSHEEYTGCRLAFGQEEALRRLLDKDGIYSQGWTKMFRRQMLLEGGVRYIDGLKTEEDFLYNLDAFVCARRVALDDTPYYVYTHREGSLSRQYHIEHTQRFVANMTMRLSRTEQMLRTTFPRLATSLTCHCLFYYNLTLGRASTAGVVVPGALSYMRRHAFMLLRHHNRVGLSLPGALLLLLLPDALYRRYRSRK